MRLLHLVCAVGLLLYPHAISCDLHKYHARTNLNIVFDLAEQCSTSLSGTFFVEDVSRLTEGSNACEDKFFCKVQEILENLKHFCENSQKLVATLKMYNSHRNVNCTEALQGMTHTGYEITVSKLLKDLMHCIRQRNVRGTK